MCQLLKAAFRVSLSDLPLITQGDYEGVFSFWRENWQSFFLGMEIGKVYNILVTQIISQFLYAVNPLFFFIHQSCQITVIKIAKNFAILSFFLVRIISVAHIHFASDRHVLPSVFAHVCLTFVGADAIKWDLEFLFLYLLFIFEEISFKFEQINGID